MTTLSLRRIRKWWRRAERREPRYVYVSYHKCATQFTERVLRAACKIHGLRAATFDSRHPKVTPAQLAGADFLLLNDYSSAMVDLGALSARGLYVTRDPRDILVSMYFSHRFSHEVNHPEIGRDRAVLATLGVPEGLDYLLRSSGYFQRIMREMAQWPQPRRGYFETTFERLTTDPQGEFGRIFAFLELPIGERTLAAILQHNSFSALKAGWAKSNPDAPVNHYRQGAPGDWRQHLVGASRERFRAEYGPLLVRLGFEPTLDW